jgi:hypothetical protein
MNVFLAVSPILCRLRADPIEVLFAAAFVLFGS